MIANISPNNGSFGETQNTLHWANRAKEIRTKVSTQVLLLGTHLVTILATMSANH